MVPADQNAAEGYLVIHRALEKAKKLGIGQVTMGGREHLVAVGPLENGLVMEILRYANEIKPAKGFFDELPDMKLEAEMLELASQLIARKAGKFDPGRFKDSYATALRELVEEKAKGQRIVTAPEPEPRGQVINLMDALRRSVKGSKEAEPTAATGRSSTRKRAGSRK
jgi:DNA end-binding protein Ku